MSETTAQPASTQTAQTPASNLEAQSLENTDTTTDTEETDLPEEKPTAAEKKKWKLKVDGKDLEIDDEEELLKRAQMGFGAQKKFEEAAALRKELGEFIQLMQVDPVEAMKVMGMDPDKFAEDHINKRIQEMQKSPEQVAQEKFQKEYEKLKKEKEDLENQTRSLEMTRLKEQYASEIENEIHEVLTSSKTLPKSPYVVKRIADALLLAHTNDLGEGGGIKVADVLPVVEKEIRKEIQEMFATMPEELVEAVIGKDVFNRVRKKRVKTMKEAPDTAASITPTGADVTSKQEESKKVSHRDFFKKLGSF